MAVEFRDCWFLVGCTATGKTAAGLHLAELIGAEILSLDSMAVYRGMNVGTAKPSPEEQRRVPHHLIDLVEPSATFSVAEYLAAAQAAADEVAERGKQVLFVGGTMLYLAALLRGIETGPPPNAAMRAELQEYVEEHGAAALHARLAKVDSAAAERLHPNDVKRVIRALEIVAAGNGDCRPANEHLATDSGASRVFWLDRPVEELNRRIDARVDAMFAEGLVAEVETIAAADAGFGPTSAKALGYAEVLALLRSEYDEDQARQKIKTRTRRFAKRQRTWARSLGECRSVAFEGDANQIAEKIAELGAG